MDSKIENVLTLVSEVTKIPVGQILYDRKMINVKKVCVLIIFRQYDFDSAQSFGFSWDECTESFNIKTAEILYCVEFILKKENRL